MNFKKRVKQKRWYAAVAVVGFFFLAASSCGSSSPNVSRQAANADQATSGNILHQYEVNQPAPQRPRSQLRQNLIELETAQMDTTQTTSFFFNQGVQDPIQSCPSIGFPIASTSQLTSPDQRITDHHSDGGPAVVAQIDPNGIFSGNSTGTYVICIDAQGDAYANYWEGFVQTVTGPAQWDASKHTVALVGPPSFKFSTTVHK